MADNALMNKNPPVGNVPHKKPCAWPRYCRQFAISDHLPRVCWREMVRKKCYGSLSQFAATKGPLMRNHLIWIDLVQINHGLKNESDACQELGIMVTQEHRCLVLGSKQAGVYSGNSG